MEIALEEGVDLHVYPTKKFKTIRIKVKFASPLQYETITKRALLGAVLETNSKKYPTQTALMKQLSHLFGADFGIEAEKKGRKHVLTVDLSIVNDKYLRSSQTLLQESFSFLQEILLNPNIEKGEFHHPTFLREKENLKDMYDSFYDDKQFYAALKSQALYFNDPAQQISDAGVEEQLESITPANLFETYQQMLLEDKVDIYVLGDVDVETIQKLAETFAFTKRLVAMTEPFYSQEKFVTTRKEEEKQPITQSKLNLIYQSDVYYHEKTYYAGQVFNGLFGGYPHSKLFLNVREKEGLAYYAVSELDTFRGIMAVQTGIDASQVDRVKTIISKQLQEMKEGKFEERAVLQTKRMLMNQLYQSEDHAGALIERNYASLVAGKKPLDLRGWIENIADVSVRDIQQVAANMTLEAEYLLKGE